MSFYDVLLAVVALGCWLGAAYRLRDIRRAGNRPAVVSLVAALACLGAGTALQVQGAEDLVDQLTTVPTGGRLLSHCFAMVTAYAAQTILVITLTASRREASRRTRRRAAVLTVILAAMVSLVLLAPLGPPMRVDGLPLATGSGMIYFALYAGYVGIAMVDISRMAFRYSRLADRRFLRLGMLFIAYGTALGTVYAVGKFVLVLARLVGVESAPLDRWVLGPMVLVTVVLTAGGSVLPALSNWRPLQAPVLWLVRLWTYRALRPLWARLVTSTDVPLLLPTPWLTATGSGLSPHFLLQRRVTEISDGLLQVRPHLDPAVAAAAADLADAAGLAPGERRAVMHAASIAAALRAWSPDLPVHADALEPPQFSDLDRKAWWLQQVAWAIRRSPIVRNVVEASSPKQRLSPR